MPYTTVITFVAYDPLAAADLNSNFSNLDYLNNKVNSQIILLAGAMKPVASSPATPGEVEMATNLNNYVFMDFASSSDSAVSIAFPLPSDYNGGTITAKFYWTANSTATDSVVWWIAGACITENESLSIAYSGAQTVTDANKSAAYKLNISDSTGNITIAGTPTAGELVTFFIARAWSDAGDNLAVSARLIAVVLTYTRS